MSLSSTKVNSIELVQPEIEATIQQAEVSLTRFQENRDSGEDLQNCIDCLNQLRGIFIVVEVQGCVLLCQESVALANEVPVGAHDDKNGLLANLSNAIFILRRYTEYFSHKKTDHPELLLPIINELRQARKAKPFPESHFFDIDSEISVDIAGTCGIDASKKLDNFEHHARRFRHMFQVGLLDLLRDRNVTIALRLINRSSEGSARLCAGESLAQFWALVMTVSDSMVRNEMGISDLRKRLFMKVEKYLREMAMVGKVVAAKSAPESLKKDLLYLLSISGDDSAHVQEILEAHDIVQTGLTDRVLVDESKRLFGPGVDVLRSLSKAIQEEMAQLKEKLDILERGSEPSEEDMEFIAGGLTRLSGTLSMLDLTQISSLCKEQAETVTSWIGQDRLISEVQLLDVADAILTIEVAIKKFEETGAQPELSELQGGGSDSENSYLKEARLVVIEESESGLALTKRSITSYVESNGDKLHLANVVQVLEGIRGGMLMIDQSRLAELISASSRCIEAELYESEAMPDQTLLETLADALTSLEYYIESMRYKDSTNEELLKLAEDSLRSVGYAVSETS